MNKYIGPFLLYLSVIFTPFSHLSAASHSRQSSLRLCCSTLLLITLALQQRAAGQKSMITTLGGSNEEAGYGVGCSSDENHCWTIGYTKSYGMGEEDIALTAYQGWDNPISTYTLGTATMDKGWAIMHHEKETFFFTATTKIAGYEQFLLGRLNGTTLTTLYRSMDIEASHCKAIAPKDGGGVIGCDAKRDVVGNTTFIGGQDLWLLAFDGSSQPLLSTVIGTLWDDYLGGMIVNGAGDIVIVGTTAYGIGNYSLFVVKVAGTDFDILWRRGISGLATQQDCGIIEGEGGYTIVTTIAGLDGGQVAIARLSDAGLWEWVKSYGSNSTMQGTAIGKSSDGGFQVFASRQGYSTGIVHTLFDAQGLSLGSVALEGSIVRQVVAGNTTGTIAIGSNENDMAFIVLGSTQGSCSTMVELPLSLITSSIAFTIPSFMQQAFTPNMTLYPRSLYQVPLRLRESCLATYLPTTTPTLPPSTFIISPAQGTLDLPSRKSPLTIAESAFLIGGVSLFFSCCCWSVFWVTYVIDKRAVEQKREDAEQKNQKIVKRPSIDILVNDANLDGASNSTLETAITNKKIEKALQKQSGKNKVIVKSFFTKVMEKIKPEKIKSTYALEDA